MHNMECNVSVLILHSIFSDLLLGIVVASHHLTQDKCQYSERILCRLRKSHFANL